MKKRQKKKNLKKEYEKISKAYWESINHMAKFTIEQRKFFETVNKFTKVQKVDTFEPSNKL